MDKLKQGPTIHDEVKAGRYLFGARKKRRRAVKLSKMLKYHVKLQNGRCIYCDREFQPKGQYAASLEHLTPTSLGGDDSHENTAASCIKCNGKKGNLTDSEYRALLKARKDAGRSG